MTEDSNKPKLCKNCKWCRPDIMKRIFTLGFSDGLKFAKCARPKEWSIDLITGKQLDIFCSAERSLNCGKDAKYYEAKK